MPLFSHGSKARLYANGHDLSPYFKSVQASGEIDTADTTAFGDTFHSFITGQANGQLSAEGMHDDSAGAVTSVLSTALTDAASEITHWFDTDAVGQHGFGMQGVETTFNITTPVSDVAAISFEAASKTAFERITSLQAKATGVTSGTTFGAAVDTVAQTTDGASGYLHVFTGASSGEVVAKVQQSASGTASWTDLITFATVAANNASERATVTGTVQRYLRAAVIKTGSGTVSASISACKTPYL